MTGKDRKVISLDEYRRNKKREADEVNAKLEARYSPKKCECKHRPLMKAFLPVAITAPIFLLALIYAMKIGLKWSGLIGVEFILYFCAITFLLAVCFENKIMPAFLHRGGCPRYRGLFSFLKKE